MKKINQKYEIRKTPIKTPNNQPPPIKYRISLYDFSQFTNKKPWLGSYLIPRCRSNVEKFKNIQNYQNNQNNNYNPLKVEYKKNNNFYDYTPKLCIYNKSDISSKIFRRPELPKRPQSAPPRSSKNRMKKKKEVYAEPCIIYENHTYKLPTCDYAPYENDFIIDEPNNMSNYNNENDLIIEDIDEDIDLPNCNKVIYDEYTFDDNEKEKKKKRPSTARPASARHKNFENNKLKPRPQSAFPLVPQRPKIINALINTKMKDIVYNINIRKIIMV